MANTEDRDSLEYLIQLKEKYDNRYEGKPFKPRPSEVAQSHKPVTGYDFPLGGFPLICGSYKSQVENF